jgi:hypothetical protein
MSCGTSAMRASSIPSGYSLSQLATSTAPATLNDLQHWLLANSPSGSWIGKLYVASTISWTGTAFVQEGSSPNYRVGWWTLTCCKHEMRSAGPINDALKRPANIAVFIFTLAKQDASKNQYLVSVAKVTTHCKDMADYARHLFKLRSAALTSSRLTRCGRNASLGWRFGDCHANPKGVIGAPHVDHVHGSKFGNCWAPDNAPGPTLLMSDHFLISCVHRGF